jgi:predicted transcriptional regulator of viral defense system
MKFTELKQNLRDLPVFTVNDILLDYPGFRRATLYEWESKGLVTKLRNNKYIFSDFIPHDKDFYFLSNEIYEPSYVSLETALNHYSIIPEAVQTVTAVSTNKTREFDTPVGTFSYSSLAERLFFGYKTLTWDSGSALISYPEKVVLDYLYLNPSADSLEDFESLRWNREILREIIILEQLDDFTSIFDNVALTARVAVLKEYINA